MKKIIFKILSSGVWIWPISLGAIVWFLQEYRPGFLDSISGWGICVMASFLPWLIIKAGMTGKPKAEDAMVGKEAAMYPSINSELLFKEPEGVILGRDKRTDRYVCRSLSRDGHVLVIGGSGSGKSSCLVIPALLTNKDARVFCVDIKGELSFKSTKYGDEQVKIFKPTDRSQFGYDPLYRLSEQSTSQEIMETMQTIAFSLISMPANLQDPFWKISSRNLLIGLLIYFYRQGAHSFIAIVDKILSKPAKDNIKEALENSQPNSLEYRYCVQFQDMADETLGGITAEMNNHLVIFVNDMNIRFAFRDNPCKIAPTDLDDGYSIYLSINEEKLSAYYDVMQLIINQTISELERRPENSDPIIMVIDELPRILSTGKLDRLLDGARTLRNRRVCLFLITQSLEALQTAYSEHEVTDLATNCQFIVVLSATSTKTQKAVCSWAGKYKVRRTSWSGNGKDRKTTVSYEEKDIVEPSDLMTLPNSGEAILITPYGYARVRKTPYYEDKYLAPLAEENVRYNSAVKK